MSPSAKWSDYPYVVAYGQVRGYPASLIDDKVREAAAANAGATAVYSNYVGWVTLEEIGSVELDVQLREKVQLNAQ
jgi:hypothetical protein